MVGRGGNSRNWLSPLFMLIHYSMAKYDNIPCVCHKDNNPLNNHYKNLYWGTHQENMAQMIVDGRKQKGEECPRWVNKEIPELFDYYCDGVSTMELAEMFNTNKSMINKIIRYKFKELWQGRK